MFRVLSSVFLKVLKNCFEERLDELLIILEKSMYFRKGWGFIIG